MKNNISTLYIILFSILLSSSVSAVVENKHKGSIEVADNILVKEFGRQYRLLFKKNIEKYNKRRGNIPQIISEYSGENKKYLKDIIAKGNITIFPKINYKNGAAKLKIGDKNLMFTVGSLFNGYYLLNGKKIYMKKGSIKKQLEQLNKEKSRFTSLDLPILDLIISTAYATEKFEHLLLGTIIILNDSFSENEWCLSCEDEYLDATKDNFKIVMNEVASRARACQEGEEDEYFAFRIGELDEYKSASYDLQEKLRTYFKTLPMDSEMNCESVVNKIYQDEIKATQVKAPFYSDSITVRKNKEGNKKRYEKFIRLQCQPYAELKNCLVSKSYEAREVFNRTRKREGKKKIRNDKTLPKNYEVKSKGL